MHYSFDTTGNPAIIRTALQVVRPLGLCGLVGVGKADIVLPQQLLGSGRRLMHPREGNVDPRTFVPRLVGLWRQGRFPFERLVRTYELDGINDAAADSLDGIAVKPVLLPTPENRDTGDPAVPAAGTGTEMTIEGSTT